MVASVTHKVRGEEGQSLTLGPVAVRFSHVCKEDPNYGGFKITVDLTDEQRAELEQQFEDVINEVHSNTINVLKKKGAKKVGIRFKAATDKEGNEEEGISTLTMTSKYPVTVFDVKGNPLKFTGARNDLWSGDLVNVAYTANVDYQPRKGEVAVKFYLNGVQLLKMRQSGGSGSGGSKFGDASKEFEDYTETTNFFKSAAEDATDEDEAPFDTGNSALDDLE